MTSPFNILSSSIMSGVTPFLIPLTMTAAPAEEEVTGILCVLFRVKVAQAGESSTLVTARKRNRAAFFLHMRTLLSLRNVSRTKRKVVKVVSILGLRPGGVGGQALEAHNY